VDLLAELTVVDWRRIGLAVAVAVPTVSAAVASGWLALIEHDRHAHEEVRSTTRSVEAAVDLKLESYKAALVTLVRSDELSMAGAPVIMRGEARRVADAFGGWVVVTTAGDPIDVLLDTSVPEDRPLPQARPEPPEVAAVIARSVASQQPEVSDVFAGFFAERPVVTIAMPLPSEAAVSHVAYFVFDTVRLSTILMEQPLGASDLAVLVDGSGRIVARSVDPDPFVLQPLPDWAMDILGTSTDGVVEGAAPTDGGTALYGYETLESAPDWRVMVARPASGGLTAILQSVWPAIVTLVTFLVAAALVTLKVRHDTSAAELERTRAEAAEKAVLLEEIRDADQKKSNMISVLSHEMRTPLVSLLGAMDLLRAEGLSRGQAEHVDLASRDGEILLRLIDDVLELARLGAGQLRFEPVSFDPAEVARDVAAIVGPEAQRKSLSVTVTLAPGIRRLVGDVHRIRQVLLNYATNAVRFTERGSIDVSATPLGPSGGEQSIEFAVRDTGVGIAAEDIPKLFTDFGMLDNTRTGPHAGAGLGLAISRRLVHAMGGEAGVTSREGEGSRFWFRLTLPEANEGVDLGPIEELPAGNSLRGFRVLVAEDQELVRLLTKRRLEAAGADVEEAVDGMQAVLIAERMPLDLILMDLMMPKLDGATAAQRIRSGRGPSADARIVGLTAHQQPESTLILSRLAMDACLEKPLDLKALLALLTMDAPVSDRRPPSVGETEAILDPAAVKALRAAAPPRFVGAAFERFAEEIEARTGEMNDAVEEGRWDQVRQVAHKLAGLCLTMGGQALASRLRAIAAAARAGEPDRVRAEIAGLADIAETTRMEALAAAADFEAA
jgi:signal transduction histidine kinase/ActR/RegA family two-component response regulator/HPt (histidine-containing phosphotransfer) domain-containing protein